MISIYLLHVHENPEKGKGGGGGGPTKKVWVEVCRRGFQTLTLLIFTAILPKQLYKAHTPCIHYLRERRHIVHWCYICVYGLALLPCSLSAPWHLSDGLIFLFLPYSTPLYRGSLSLIRKRPRDFPGPFLI